MRPGAETAVVGGCAAAVVRPDTAGQTGDGWCTEVATAVVDIAVAAAIEVRHEIGWLVRPSLALMVDIDCIAVGRAAVDIAAAEVPTGSVEPAPGAVVGPVSGMLPGRRQSFRPTVAGSRCRPLPGRERSDLGSSRVMSSAEHCRGVWRRVTD